MYFLTCDEYEIDGGETCNVFVFSDTRMTWKTKELDVYQSTFYLRQDLDTDTEYTGADFGTADDGAKCYPEEPVP